MKQIKKSLSIFMAAIFVMAGVLGNVAVKAAQVTVPVINYIGVEHSPLVVGDTEKFTITSTYTGDVQYRAFLYNEKANKWSELTEGYNKVAVNANTPYVLPETAKFDAGKYKLSVWVKRAGETGIQSNKNGDFDSYYVSALNCVAKDNDNRVYANGEATYVVNGMNLTFNRVEGMSGIAGPYSYRLHIFDPTAVSATNDGWTKRVTEYTENPSYKFTKPGTYMVVVHANTAKSTTWKNYLAEDKTVANQKSTYGTYEAWKTIKVEVKAEEVLTVFDTTIKAGTVSPVANVTMTVAGAKHFATAAKYQLFDGEKAVSAIATLGTATSVYPKKVEGEKVSVKLLDSTDKLIETIEVALGKSGTITIKAVEPSTSEVKATIKEAAFGSAITVTATQEGAVKYQIYDGAKAISAPTELGKATTIPAGKSAGAKVNVKLLNAAGVVVATNEVVLVAAK
ncbi:MAG: hypothetical protein ACREV6_09170 [Clostridium sp.]|uniref:hypothetical protein n=1 Tax=Clostridium sp. TaxID=1506 RepID=UPI003D6D17C8